MQPNQPPQTQPAQQAAGAVNGATFAPKTAPTAGGAHHYNDDVPKEQQVGQPVSNPAVTAQMQPAGQPQPVAKPAVNPNSTQNALEIAEVRDGIVIMGDGSFRAVVMCKSINFDLMSPQEREGVEFAYQGFLNSLYFPIQIMVRSRKVDLRPYLEKLEKIRNEHDNMLLSVLMEDYIYFMQDLSQQTNIMDKMFYVVVPFFREGLDAKNAIRETGNMFSNIFNFNKTPDHVTIDEATLERAKEELRNRVQSVMQGLQQTGVQSLPLDTQELIELYYDSYNPDTATRQKLKDFEGMTVPVVTKGEGEAVNPNLNREMH